ncbi:MAG: tetratricopeptide repeat protein [Acidobacteria bacterium]|nr:tetratricopeptide repeat protein [Acidobacteriota bacterium]
MKSGKRGGSERKRRTAGPAPQPAADRVPPPVRTSGWAALIVLAGVLLFVPSLEYEFVFDDFTLVRDNEAIQSLEQAARATVQGVAYRPLRTLSYALDHAVGGMDPFVFHLSNLAWFALLLAAAWLVLRAAGLGDAAALAALALFAAHPVHVDAVTYISGRRDLLSALFILLAFWAYLQFRRTRRAWWWAVVLTSFLLAFMAKELGIVVPALIFLYEWAEETAAAEGGPWRRLGQGIGRTLRNGWWYWLPVTLLGAGLVVYKVFLTATSGKVGWWGGSFVTNLLTVAKVLAYDLWLMVLPITLRADYSYDGFPIAYTWADPLGLAAAALVVALIAALVWLVAAGRRQTAFWGLWFFVAVLPMAHLVPHHELLAEHYLLLPSLGACALGGLGLVWLHGRSRRLAWVVGGVVMAFFVTVLLTHSPVYRDNVTLFADTVAKAPRCVRANRVLAEHHFNRGEYDRAVPYLERILAVPPLFERERAGAEERRRLTRVMKKRGGEYVNREVGMYMTTYRQLGHIYETRGEHQRAIDLFLDGSRLGALEDMFYNDLGNLYARTGRWDDAARWFRRAVADDPENYMAWSNLAAVHAERGRLDESRDCLERALRIRPDFAQAWYNLALLLNHQGAPAERVAGHLARALELGLPSPDKENAEALLMRLRTP